MKLHEAIAKLLHIPEDFAFLKVKLYIREGDNLVQLGEHFHFMGDELARLSGMVGITNLVTPLRKQPEFSKSYR